MIPLSLCNIPAEPAPPEALLSGMWSIYSTNAGWSTSHGVGVNSCGVFVDQLFVCAIKFSVCTHTQTYMYMYIWRVCVCVRVLRWHGSLYQLVMFKVWHGQSVCSVGEVDRPKWSER